MKKVFKFFMMVLLVLFVGVGSMWAVESSTIYLASLKAQTDPASTGSGQVKLTWLDITGKPFENSIGVGPSGLNPTNPVGPAATAQMVAGTMIAIEGTEVAQEIGGSGSQIYMTSVVYFHAEGFPDNGSYLADWTFTDPQITRMTSEMNPADPMGGPIYESYTVWDEELQENVYPIKEMVPYRTPCFKVLPKLENSATYPSMEVYDKVAAVTADPNNIYALFSKYLLSNPVATNAILEAEENATANLTVTVEINGDAASLDAADFATFTFTNNSSTEWSYDLAAALASKEVVSAQKTRITIPVTYTYKNTGFGLKNTTMTISMAGESASTLNVNLSVNALDPGRAEAFWFDGETEKTSGNLSDMLATDISGYTKPILKLNKPVAIDLTFSGKYFTLDLNGNTTHAITVSSGNVTIAYSKYGGEASSLTVNGGKAILNGGTFGSLAISASGTVEQNGATITGAANNAGSLTTTEGTINGGLTSSKTLVINGGTFKGTTAVIVSGGTATINRGTIDGTTCGLKVIGGTATTKKLASITSDGDYSAKQERTGVLNVESGKFGKPLNGSVNFTAGFFKNVGDTVGLSAGKTGMLVSAGVEYNEGYRYFLGTSESALANGVGVCRIGTTSYARLEDAIAYANNNPLVENIVIFMTNDYTLPAGYYTLPANATIVVPMSDSQEKEVNMTAPRIIFNDERTATPYTSILPTEFRRLTFASGVNMNVFGQIEMTCSQYASNEAYTAQPVGPYGHLVMEEGSSVTLQSGSEVRAWGFVTGKGEMDARRGAKVREMFQLGDWKGAFTSVKIVGMVTPDQQPLYNIIGDESDKKIFPVTQYFIQNIESPVKYHPGAVLSTSAAVSEGLMNMSVSMAATDIAIVGVTGQHQAIFLMDQMADADNTWVRKWYDSENDIQVYDINSAAHIGSMVLDMGDINLLTYGTVPVRLNSAKFDLPLTSNFKIHLLSGTMDFKQNTSLLPGAVVEVDKEATVTVAKDNSDTEHTGALYVYDADDWHRYAYCNEYDGLNMVKDSAFTKTVRYAPSANNGEGGRPTVRDEQTKPADAAINVHGTFRTATGFVYCSEHGANIFSNNEDAGTFIFNQSASAAGTRTVCNVKGSGTFESLTFYPAKLKNGVADPAFANTSTAVAGDAYCYTDSVWNIFEKTGCFMMDDYHVYYANPQEYVALANGMTENDDHTYSDAAGAGRLFILMENGCQWWEVEKKDNLYHCIHPDNDTYYYWGEDDFGLERWLEKKFTITWKNWDGTIIKTYSQEENAYVDSYIVTYGTMAEFLGTNPTRESNIDYTYDFTGWTPALGKVTSDVTYTATYTEKPRMYTIIFRQEGGLEIERQLLKHNEVPVCENTPTKIGHTLVWSPAIAAVTGDATYTATWLENPPTEYEVTFYDYNGTTVLKQGDVAVGATPVAPAIVNGKPQKEDESFGGKPATNEFTYVFDHWSPALEEVSATSIKSYTAVYAEVAKTYTIKFVKENGDPDTPADVIESHQYQYGETPVCANTPSKLATPQYTYKLRWDPQIQTVMGDANYTAVFDSTLNKYAVSVMSNPSGACAISGAGIYDYNTSADAVTITITPNAGYTFTGWSDGQGGTSTTRQMAVTADINLLANFTVDDPDVYITWKNEAGTANLVNPVGQKAGTATIYTGAIPTKSATAQSTFTFDGWTTEANGAGTFYKNNMTPKATANATYYAHFAATEVVMEVGLGQAQDIAEETTVNQLIINSNGMVSGQLTGDINNILNVTGACYYDLTGTFTAGKWYAVAVPWQVKASDIRANGNALSWMSGDYLAYYDGSVRAEQGMVDACWKYVTNGSTLEPGRLYMLYLANNASVLRFPKKAGSNILTTSTSVEAYGSDVATDANWNGIANPAIFYAYLNNTGATVGQVFNADAQSYEAVALSNKLIVAKPIFVQATNTGSATAVTTPPTSAPIRRNANVETQKAECQVTITSRGRMQDRLFIHADENKEADTYTVGQDVLKFGVSSSVAQMWVNRYDAKLCMNTMAPVNNVAEFPLSIYAPKDGDYTIAIEKEQVTDDYSLYLTYNGEAIWNLSDGAYTANLEKGTDANYGLRITFKAPEVATGIDEAIVDSKDATAAKVLINGHVFIIREGAVYTINGQLVK